MGLGLGPNGAGAEERFVAAGPWLAPHPVVPAPALARAGAAYDVRREAAFNLSLILRASGAEPLARQLLRQHLTI